jgi:hypothetical protein
MKLFLLFLSLQFINSNLPDKVSVRENQVNILIDASDKIGKFHEKVYYNLEFKNNEIKNVNLTKFLPQIDSNFFDLKVKSKDVNILKYELSEKKDNFDKNNKVLNIVFEGKDQNYNQGDVKIDYEYSVNNFGISDKNQASVKNTYYLKDISFPSETVYNSKFSIEINNLPNNLKVKRVNFRGEDVKYDNDKNHSNKLVETKGNIIKSKTRLNSLENIQNKNSNINQDYVSLNFNLQANNSTDNKLKIEFENNENNQNNQIKENYRSDSPKYPKNNHPDHKTPNSNANNNKSPAPAPPASSNQPEPKVEYKNGKKITTYYYYKEKHSDNKNQSFIDSLIVFLIVVCVCFYCCCTHSEAPKDHHDPHQNNNPHDTGPNNPDGFYTY